MDGSDMDYNTWYCETSAGYRSTKNVRKGQYFMNTLPDAAYNYVSQDYFLDAFYRDENLPNLLAFLELVWDEPYEDWKAYRLALYFETRKD